VNAADRKIEFAGAQGDRLAARLDLPASTPLAFGVFAHCFTCTKDTLAATYISRALVGEGIAVLRFDFTGLGGSDGDFANTNFSSNLGDLVAAADFLRREYQAPQLLIGHSLGGAAVLAASVQIAEVRAVATVNAPADVAHVIAQIGDKVAEIESQGEASVKLAGRTFRIQRQFLEDVSSQKLLQIVAHLNRSLLVFHAPLDTTVGVDHAARIFTAARHPKSFVSLDHADHLLSRREDAQYVGRVLAAWVSRYLRTTPAGQSP